MLTREENELLCRVGSASPMGQMLRRYWIPAALSEELEAGGAPKRVRLLGDDLVAFRDRSGAVALLDEACPHRGASLVLARNEDCGLRCIYHGWKIDLTGAVVEMPAEPEGSSFAQRVRAQWYPTREAGGIVWAYLGPPAEEPAFMDFEWTSMPASHRVIFKARTDCNWVQALEGVIDSAHSSFLHADSIVPAAVQTTVYKNDLVLDRPSNDTRPRLEVETTPYGFCYAAIRKPIVDPQTTKYVRVTLFVAPFYATFPAPAGLGIWQIFVPIDDEHTAFYYVQYSYGKAFDEETIARRALRAGMRPGADLDDSFGRRQRRENNWMQDRSRMTGENASYSGITGVQAQDMAVQESMGALYDRSKEHLGASDVALIRMRRLMLESVREFAERGAAPYGLRAPVRYAELRSWERLMPIGEPWQEAFEQLVR